MLRKPRARNKVRAAPPQAQPNQADQLKRVKRVGAMGRIRKDLINHVAARARNRVILAIHLNQKMSMERIHKIRSLRVPLSLCKAMALSHKIQRQGILRKRQMAMIPNPQIRDRRMLMHPWMAMTPNHKIQIVALPQIPWAEKAPRPQIFPYLIMTPIPSRAKGRRPQILFRTPQRRQARPSESRRYHQYPPQPLPCLPFDWGCRSIKPSRIPPRPLERMAPMHKKSLVNGNGENSFAQLTWMLYDEMLMLH